MAGDYVLITQEQFDRMMRATKIVEANYQGGPPGQRQTHPRPGAIIRFVEFTEALQPGGTAEAKLLYRKDVAEWEPVDPEETVTVEDDLGVSAAEGDKAWVEYYGEAWYVIRLEEEPYALDDCKRTTPTIYVTNDLADSLGKVVKVNGRCYRVRRPRPSELECAVPACAPIAGVYDDCDECLACWKLVRCGEPSEIKYTNTDLSRAAGKVVRLPDGYCYTVSQADNCLDASPVSVAEVYENCTSCTHCYTLDPCYGGGDSITVANDLAAFSGFSADDLVADGRVFQIEGVCYTVTGYGEACESAQFVNVTNHFTECNQCGCYILEECLPEGDPGEPGIIKAHSATKDGETVDLAGLVGRTVKLSGGDVYTVKEHTTECDGAVSVEILEDYADCDSALTYTLNPCDGEGDPVTTYTDLSEYEEGDVLKLSGECYTLGASSAEHDPFAVSVTVEEESPDCDTCLRLKKYFLSAGDCKNEACGEGGGAPENIVTKTDLHAAVGKWVKVGGHCYEVFGDAVGEVTRENVSYQGPFEDCDECQKAPVTATKQVVTDVYVEGDVLKYDVEEWIIVDGLIVGFCAKEAQEVDSTSDCPETP